MRVAFPSFPGPSDARPTQPRWPTGVDDIDARLGGGLSFGRVHEFYAAEGADSSACAGLVAAAAIGSSATRNTVIWLRTRASLRATGTIQGVGWAELGGAPDRCLWVCTDDAKALLRASVDTLRSVASATVVIEAHGRMTELDLTANRRLALAAERSGAMVLMLRSGAEPVPSAAETRWRVAAAPSRPLAANAPGQPAFDIELLRQRSGLSGMRWRLEWDRDRRTFTDATLSGAVVSAPVGRPAAPSTVIPLRRIA